MEKAIVIYSGGMDSFTLLNDVRKSFDVHAISFDYSQRHDIELDFAAEFCETEEIPYHLVNMTEIGSTLLQGSSQTSEDIAVPKGHYEDHSMRLTVVPNRNMIMLSLAIGYAVSVNAKVVFFGAHSGDHAIYPDCRPEFVHAMDTVSKVGNYARVSVVAPYINMDKGEILARGLELNLDYSKTWTCYDPQPGNVACGKCGACQERLEAFRNNRITDPITYAVDLEEE